MQEALISAIDVVGPSTYTAPPPQLDDNAARRRTLIAVTAAQPLDPAGAGITIPAAGGGPVPVVLDPKTAVDLTPKVSNGVLTWEVPAGRWKLVATWMRPTGQRVHGDAVTLAGAAAEANLPANLPDLGGELGPLVPDHFSRAAIDATLGDYEDTLFGADMASVLRRNGGHVFEDSLELNHETVSSPLPDEADGCIACSGRFWTPALLQEFRSRRGYDVTPLLPVIFGSFDLPDGGGARVKADYDRTISDLLVDNHFKPIRRWANARGLKSRAQGYKLHGTDKTRVSASLELPDAESLDFGETGDAVAPGTPAAAIVIDDYRQVVSGAHLSGAGEITLEAGANIAGEYDMSVDDYKVIADRAYAAGVTTMALHGFAYRTYQDLYQPWSWPGWSAFNLLFAESWSQAHPAMAQWDGLAGYYGRISAALQSGRPRVDLTVLSTPSSSHTYGSADLADALRAGDYTSDRLDDASLGELPAAKDRRILPSGPAYRALVIDGVPAISQGAAEKALALAKAGVPVVIMGDLPAHGTSYRDAGAQDAAIRAAFDALLKLPNARRVKTAKDVVAALSDLRVAAGLRRGELPIVAQHRRTARGDVWFLYNNSTETSSGELTFLATGRPSRIDPWTGRATRLGEYRATRHSTRLPVALGPGETVLIAFDRKAGRALHAETADGDVVVDGRSLNVRDTEGGAHEAQLSNGRRRTVQLPSPPAPITVEGPWSLGVRTAGPDGDGKVDLELTKLADWREIPALSGASGTGTYTARFALPDGWLSSGRGVLLDPGVIGGFLRLQINGRPVPIPSLADGPRDVTSLLRSGGNEIRAVVATTVTNVIVARAQSGDARYVAFAKNSKQRYGLIGPVRLIPFAEARLATLPRACRSRRRFAIHVRAPKGFRQRSALLRIGSRTAVPRVRRVSGRRLRVALDLRRLPAGTVLVRLSIGGTGGRVVKTTRTYRLCARSGH